MVQIKVNLSKPHLETATTTNKRLKPKMHYHKGIEKKRGTNTNSVTKFSTRRFERTPKCKETVTHQTQKQQIGNHATKHKQKKNTLKKK